MAIAVKPDIDYTAVVHLLDEAPTDCAWLNYDREADVLYINYVTPAISDGGEEIRPGVHAHYDAEERLIGYSILNASKQVQRIAPG